MSMNRKPLVITVSLALFAVVLASLVHRTDAASLPAAKDVPAKPTFHRDVAPIVFVNCSGCHHAGEVAPFSLMTYEEVKKKGQISGHVLMDHVMPPWKAEPGYGDFIDARVLTDQQIAIFDKWVEN